jgi:methyl-accepting chemotaxis protein
MNPTNSYLLRIHQAGDRLLLGVLGALVVLSCALAPWYDTWAEALTIGGSTFAVCAWLVYAAPGALATRCTIAAGFMIMTALQIHQAHGMPELHFGVFVLLAFLLVYRDWIPLVVAAGVIAVQHLAFDFAQRSGTPVWVFGYRTGFGIVVIHAAYVIFETGLLVAIAIRLKAESTAIGCEPSKLSQVAQRLAAGDVDVELDTLGASAGSVAEAMTVMRTALRHALGDTTAVLQAIAHGDLSRRVTASGSGEFARLREHVNATADFLARFMDLQNQLIRRANEGDFSVRCDRAGLAGYQVELANGLDGLSQSMQTFISSFSEALGAMANGDLTVNIAASFPGRLGDLKRDTNATISRLREVIGRIDAAAHSIAQASSEIAKGNMDLSTRTEEQSTALAQTSDTLRNLTDNVRRNAQNAALANQLSHTATSAAERGGAVVSEVIGTMDGIRDSSAKIADIVSMIQEIAFQTNLLALNAAVEAARAGEHGRGFAVVASEVRALAARSATAAKEIHGLIAEGITRVEAGSALVTVAGSVMQDIVDSVRRVTVVIGEISDASANQSGSLTSVERVVRSMEDVTQQNAALVEQAAAAAGSLASQTQHLVNAIRVFKVDAIARARPAAVAAISSR